MLGYAHRGHRGPGFQQDEDTDGTGASQLKSSSDNLGDEGGHEGEDGDSGQDVPPTDSEDESVGLPPRRSMRLSPQKPENPPPPRVRRQIASPAPPRPSFLVVVVVVVVAVVAVAVGSSSR